MSDFLSAIRPHVVVELEQINCKPGDVVVLATRQEMSKQTRAAVQEQLEPIASAKGVQFAIFDGFSFAVVPGAKQ